MRKIIIITLVALALVIPQLSFAKTPVYYCGEVPSCDVADTDCDGLIDSIERPLGTNPMKKDTDYDGIIDGCEDFNNNGVFEPKLGETNPIKWDSDLDLLGDGEELTIGTNPLHWDTDLDTIMDGLDPCPFDPTNRCPIEVVEEDYVDEEIIIVPDDVVIVIEEEEEEWEEEVDGEYVEEYEQYEEEETYEDDGCDDWCE